MHFTHIFLPLTEIFEGNREKKKSFTTSKVYIHISKCLNFLYFNWIIQKCTFLYLHPLTLIPFLWSNLGYMHICTYTYKYFYKSLICQPILIWRQHLKLSFHYIPSWRHSLLQNSSSFSSILITHLIT